MSAVAIGVIRLSAGETQAFIRNRTGEHAGDVAPAHRESMASFELGQCERELMIVSSLRRLLDDFAAAH